MKRLYILPPHTCISLSKKICLKYFNNEPMYRIGVPGDGSCFFHSLCAALNIEDYLSKCVKKQHEIGHRFRCGFTKNISIEDWSQFCNKSGLESTNACSSTLKELKNRFCNHKVWADQPVIQYTMDKLGINIIFIDERMHKLFCGVNGSSPNTQPTIIIMWVDRRHFEPLARLSGYRDNNIVGMQMLFDPSDKKDNIITIDFVNKYKDECH